MLSLKDRAAAFLMSRIGKTAVVRNTVLLPYHLLQVTLHMPVALAWRSGQHIKCDTGSGAYRDYTLAQWDPVQQTAILLVYTGHKGAGSSWAQQLQPGQQITYAGPGGGLHQPPDTGSLVCIGDASALGHFASLYHKKRPGQAFHCLLACGQKQAAPSEVLGMPVQPFTYARDSYITTVTAYLQQCHALPHATTFYLAGHTPLVSDARRQLKAGGWQHLKTAGFWK